LGVILNSKVIFDNKKYFELQTKEILNRVSKFSKLYLEFGGKLLTDYHAARVLPGYKFDVKTRILQEISDKSAIIYCVCAKDLQRGRVRADFGLTYDNVVIKEINDLRENNLFVVGVVITRFEKESAAVKFKTRLENLGEIVYTSPEIPGYPQDIDKVIGIEGFGKYPYIKTDREIIIVTGAGGGSGKMSVCLSQVYHNNMNKINAGYAKLETFPIWNLELEHPVNLAYEAATADLLDRNQIDPFHMDMYSIKAINYNRDIENFEIMKKLIDKIVNKDNFVLTYNSPTDMGVNMAKQGIVDDDAVRNAAKQEIIRRYFRYRKEFFFGIESLSTLNRMNDIMLKSRIKPEERECVIPARNNYSSAKEKDPLNKTFSAALILHNNKIIIGKSSKLLHAESAVILNAIKIIAGIQDNIDLLPESIIKQIQTLRTDLFKMNYTRLNLEETLITLAISAATNPTAKICLEKLNDLSGCEMHVTGVPASADETALRKLNINVTCDVKLPFDQNEN